MRSDFRSRRHTWVPPRFRRWRAQPRRATASRPSPRASRARPSSCSVCMKACSPGSTQLRSVACYGLPTRRFALRQQSRAAIAVAALLAISETVTRPPSVAAAAGRYEDLVALFREWRHVQQPKMTNGVPDYSPPAMEEQRRALTELQKRLAAIDTQGWPVPQRVDWELVRAEMNGLEFDHRVLRPWARDPAFYRVIHPSESDIPSVVEGPLLAGSIFLWRYEPPLEAARLAEIRAQLQAIPKLLEQAKANLTEDVRDLWLLGIRVKQDESKALEAYGVRAADHHPELAADVARAREAIDAFRGWLESELPKKTGRAGVGVANYDW